MIDPETTRAPSVPLFSGAVNLKKFFLRSDGLPFLGCFAFPNLTTFELSVMPMDEDFPISQLLDFLEASSALQTVRIKIEAEMFVKYVPPERVIVLPNVEMFSMTQDQPGYRIMTHISCPSARRVSLVLEQDVEVGMSQEVFPTSATWNTIGPQYMASAIDEIALGITTTGGDIVSCSLSLLSPDSATLELGYRMVAGYGYHDETPLSLGEKHSKVFSHALKAIRTYPLLSNVKRLRIWDRCDTLTPRQFSRIAREAAELFEFLDPLEELVLDVDNLRPFLSPFFDFQNYRSRRNGARSRRSRGSQSPSGRGNPLTRNAWLLSWSWWSRSTCGVYPSSVWFFTRNFLLWGWRRGWSHGSALCISPRRQFQETIKPPCNCISVPVCSRFLKINARRYSWRHQLITMLSYRHCHVRGQTQCRELASLYFICLGKRSFRR
jgi:hypothetical protein